MNLKIQDDVIYYQEVLEQNKRNKNKTDRCTYLFMINIPYKCQSRKRRIHKEVTVNQSKDTNHISSGEKRKKPYRLLTYQFKNNTNLVTEVHILMRI